MQNIATEKLLSSYFAVLVCRQWQSGPLIYLHLPSSQEFLQEKYIKKNSLSDCKKLVFCL